MVFGNVDKTSQTFKMEKKLPLCNYFYNEYIMVDMKNKLVILYHV